MLVDIKVDIKVDLKLLKTIIDLIALIELHRQIDIINPLL